jgi:hypothetical protein
MPRVRVVVGAVIVDQVDDPASPGPGDRDTVRGRPYPTDGI